MSLTSKELMLVQDNIRMTQNSIKFMQACANTVTDPQVKNLCNQMATEHQNDLQLMMKHINSAANMQ